MKAIMSKNESPKEFGSDWVVYEYPTWHPSMKMKLLATFCMKHSFRMWKHCNVAVLSETSFGWNMLISLDEKRAISSSAKIWRGAPKHILITFLQISCPLSRAACNGIRMRKCVHQAQNVAVCMTQTRRIHLRHSKDVGSHSTWSGNKGMEGSAQKPL